MTLVAVALGSFVIGVAVGIALSESVSIARGGHTDLVRTLARTFDSLLRTPGVRYVGVGLVVVALLAQAFVGFLSIEARDRAAAAEARSSASDQRVRDLVACLSRYNRLDGQARDERVEQAAAERQDRRELWQSIGTQLDNPDSVLDVEIVKRRVDAYLDALDELDAAVATNPYPRPNLCGSPRPNGRADDE